LKNIAKLKAEMAHICEI